LCVYGMSGYAAVYRCVDANGNVIFSQHSCGPDQQSEKVNLDGIDVNRKPKPEVCKEIKKLAELIFPHISETDSILDIYSDLGGREYLSAGVTAAVNYVFNFHFNPKARQSIVVELTHAKCLDGGFGRITEKDLPDWEKIKYTKEKPKEQKQTKEQQEAQEKLCKEYDEKLTHLQARLAKAKDKSEKLQIQVDKEYLEGVKRDKCKAGLRSDKAVHPK